MDIKESVVLAQDDGGRTISDLGETGVGQAEQALQDVVYGSAAGIAGKYVEYPFDTVKVRMQSQPSDQPLRYTGPLDCFRQSIKHDGIIAGLYRGVSAPLLGAAIETSSLFFSYRVAQDVLRATLYDPQSPLPMAALCASGAASGAFTSLLLTPIELIKCKMQVPQSNGHIVRGPGPLEIMASVFRDKGVFGFWRGQLGTLIRETGGSAAWFGSYEGVSLLFRLRDHSTVSKEGIVTVDKKAPLPVHQQLLAGAVAGMSYNFVFYPADTIKSRMQTEAAGPGGQQRFLHVGKGLFREHGIRGLYRGCGITVARAAPSSAFIFTIYEGLKEMFG